VSEISSANDVPTRMKFNNPSYLRENRFSTPYPSRNSNACSQKDHMTWKDARTRDTDKTPRNLRDLCSVLTPIHPKNDGNVREKFDDTNNNGFFPLW